MSFFPAAVPSALNLLTAVNGKTALITANIDDLVTSVPVNSTSGFPASGVFSVGDEIIAYSGKTSNAFTGCTRGYDDSAAASHSTNDVVYARINAKYHNILVDEIIAIATLLGSNAQHVDLTGRPGYGIKMKSPDGTKTLTMYLDNDGNLQQTVV